MTEKVRYGILSTARIGRNSHVPAAAQAKNCEVLAISSRDPEKAEVWAEKLGIARAYGSYDELLADPDVDAVINPLPNSLHCKWTVRAARAGKHILCEKPLAVDTREAREMIAAASENGVLLMEAFTHRFNPQLRHVRKAVANGEIGPVKLARAELTYTIEDWENDSRTKSELGGGALLDAGCYCVSALRFVLGAEPVAVQGWRRMREGHGVDSTFAGLLRFPNDCLAYMATGMEQPFRCVCEVVGADGRIEIGDMFGEQAGVRVIRGGKEEVSAFSGPNRFRTQLEHFSSCILEGTPVEFAPEDALQNTRVLVALQQAAAEGKSVALWSPGACR